MKDCDIEALSKLISDPEFDPTPYLDEGLHELLWNKLSLLIANEKHLWKHLVKISNAWGYMINELKESGKINIDDENVPIILNAIKAHGASTRLIPWNAEREVRRLCKDISEAGREYELLGIEGCGLNIVKRAFRECDTDILKDAITMHEYNEWRTYACDISKYFVNEDIDFLIDSYTNKQFAVASASTICKIIDLSKCEKLWNKITELLSENFHPDCQHCICPRPPCDLKLLKTNYGLSNHQRTCDPNKDWPNPWRVLEKRMKWKRRKDGSIKKSN